MSGWLGAANYGVIQSYEIDGYLEDVNNAKGLVNTETNTQV